MKHFLPVIRRRIPVLPVIVTLALGSVGIAPPLLAQSLDGSTVVSMGNRAQQAFLRADTAALERIEADTRSWQRSQDPMTLYGYAFVKLRVMQLARDARRDEQVEAAGEACVDALDTALKASPRFSDAYNLRAACHVYLGPPASSAGSVLDSSAIRKKVVSGSSRRRPPLGRMSPRATSAGARLNLTFGRVAASAKKAIARPSSSSSSRRCNWLRDMWLRSAH